MTLFKHELQMNYKSLWIWSVCIGFINFGCLLLFERLAETMNQVSEAYSQMGGFSAALGLDRLSISTMEGFYAAELGLILAIGGAMYAAMVGAVMLSKEEEGHTAEFLHALPLGRSYIVWWKFCSVVVLILLFQVICILWELAGFALIGNMLEWRKYILFHGAQFIMQMEVGSICFLISSACKRKQTGAALGLAVLLYLMDILSRVMPDMENLKYVTPYYFSNAADIFSTSQVNMKMVGIAVTVIVVTALGADLIYGKRDLVMY